VLQGKGTVQNKILGNDIGTDANGAAAVPNQEYGVLSQNGADNNQISYNTISGNGLSGVALKGRTTAVVSFNRIGLDRAGKNAAPDGQAGKDDGHGVLINGAAEIRVEGNVISGNQKDGVFITGATATKNKVLSNLIGVTAKDDKGAVGPLGNQGNGVTVV